jgi:Zn-dependent M28 family amino/carboxypeptidase
MKSTRMLVAVGMAGLLMALLLVLALGGYRVAGTPGREQSAPLTGAGAADNSEQAMAAIRPDAIRADMRYLSDDLLEGRGTGTRGYELAAKYVAAQFEQIGLQPWGDAGTYYQRVAYRSQRPDGEKSAFTLMRGGHQETLVFRKDFITRGDPGRADSLVEADVVFVGDGVTAPDKGYDSYKDVDVKGKIVALFYGAPPSFETSLRAHYSSGEVKRANAVAHGAVGMILLDDPVLERLYGFAMQTRDLAFPQLNWLDPQGRPNDYHPDLKGQAFLSMAATKRFFAGAGRNADEIYAADKAGKTPSFDTGWKAKMQVSTKLEDVHSPNIVAKLEGSDLKLKDEYVVFTAHLDHVGIGEPVNGDSIYNGALDNASGSACLLEIARALGSHARPRRSILFVAVAGEEEGLLGSGYFAHYPTAEKRAIVANVNMDEDQMLWPLKSIIPFGAEHSSLDEVVREAARRMHLAVDPDPMPEEVVFIRSDQYSFVKQGIPAVFPVPGFKSDDPKINPAKIFASWEEQRYHQPSDDMSQPGLDFREAARFAQFNLLVGYLVAEKTDRPAWKKGDFFGEHFGKN